MNVDLSRFDAKKGLDRGAPIYVEALWYAVKMCFFLTAFPWPSGLKCGLLRIFGARVGSGVNIKPRVNIHFPWKLRLGDHCWLGEEAFLLNFETLAVGANVCISQRVFICGGNHDYRDPTFSFRNAPVIINEGVWLGAGVFVGPGVEIEKEVVVVAGSVVTKNLPAGMICSGNPAIPKGPRWKDIKLS